MTTTNCAVKFHLQFDHREKSIKLYLFTDISLFHQHPSVSSLSFYVYTMLLLIIHIIIVIKLFFPGIVLCCVQSIAHQIYTFSQQCYMFGLERSVNQQRHVISVYPECSNGNFFFIILSFHSLFANRLFSFFFKYKNHSIHNSSSIDLKAKFQLEKTSV